MLLRDSYIIEYSWTNDTAFIFPYHLLCHMLTNYGEVENIIQIKEIKEVNLHTSHTDHFLYGVLEINFSEESFQKNYSSHTNSR